MVDSLQTEIAAANLGGQSTSPLTATSDTLLVASARNGEHLAYIELCRRNREIVLRTVVRITHNLDDAEDVLQDSWMRAFTHIRTFDGRSAFSSWVTRIAINSALTMIRKRRRQKEFSLDDPVDPNCRRLTEMLEPSRNPEERCLEAERIRLVRQAIERLPSKLRTAIEIRQSQDGPISKLAMLAGVSLPTMKSRLVRARLRLREPLARVLNGRPASDISHQAKRADSVRKRPRRQSGFEKITQAHDHHSTRRPVIHRNETDAPSEITKTVIG
jgi:RNA polymerase sigma factor (sigma-70 family)